MTETVKIPNLGESITEATIGKWFKREGDFVALDEPIAELETDKVAMEVSAPVAGTLKSILAREGDTVKIGAAIAEIEPGEPKPAAMPKAPAKAPEKEKKEKILTPSARKLVKEHDVDISEVAGTAKGGRIGKEDVLKAISGKPVSAPAPAKLREERVRMTRMRQRIAERLKEAQNTAAILTTFNEVDMSAVINARSRNQELFFKKHRVKLGFMSFFTKACVHALKEIPAVNGEIDGAEIIYKNHYDIGVAISTAGGLVVPVLRDADLMSFADIERKIFDLGTRARDGKLALEELQGGTFTISNGGVFGSLLSTPILNPPQSAILGMHKIEQRPVAVNGEVVIRPMMYLALSYDHRIIDGREAVIFLVRIKELLEDTDKLLLDL
ncbi:MAG: 2-oxoglutarate dehydrogenase complex dihydrolipoyllysine-residue succinyltransferase [Proteobacteria bacterium]|nr:2-oxoglutarate dehydrogenase complex dihydrolipoyllysine-residue succinyltransferase [Pseudomonadota bacterium]